MTHATTARQSTNTFSVELEQKLQATAARLGVDYNRLAALVKANSAEDWLDEGLSSDGGMTMPTWIRLSEMLNGGHQ